MKLQEDAHVLGIISDTHGLMRPEAIKALEGVKMIIHAGDIGTPEVLEMLHAIAPVVAVRGNNDKEEWAHALPETEVVEVGGVALYVLHDVKTLDLDPVAAGFRAVISGHSHQPAIAERHIVLEPRECWAAALQVANIGSPTHRPWGYHRRSTCRTGSLTQEPSY